MRGFNNSFVWNRRFSRLHGHLKMNATNHTTTHHPTPHPSSLRPSTPPIVQPDENNNNNNNATVFDTYAPTSKYIYKCMTIPDDCPGNSICMQRNESLYPLLDVNNRTYSTCACVLELPDQSCANASHHLAAGILLVLVSGAFTVFTLHWIIETCSERKTKYSFFHFAVMLSVLCYQFVMLAHFLYPRTFKITPETSFSNVVHVYQPEGVKFIQGDEVAFILLYIAVWFTWMGYALYGAQHKRYACKRWIVSLSCIILIHPFLVASNVLYIYVDSTIYVAWFFVLLFRSVFYTNPKQDKLFKASLAAEIVMWLAFTIFRTPYLSRTPYVYHEFILAWMVFHVTVMVSEWL
jgi:hypothetical protein